MSTQELIKRSLTNSIEIETEEKANTNYVTISFSSEIEYERDDMVEILDHSSESVDFSRLNDGAAVLMDHDWTRQIGVVERAWIDDDKKGRAVVKISRSDKGSEIYQDIVDGIRTKVSVGYSVGRGRKIGQTSQGKPIVRFDWVPHEISFVAVPADPYVGVGRSLEQDQKTKEDQEQERVAEITNLGRQFGFSASYFINNGSTVERVLEHIRAGKLPEDNELNKGSESMYYTGQQEKSYSLGNVLRSLVNGDNSKIERELDVSHQISREQGRNPGGIYVPFGMFFGRSLSRANAVNTTTSAGEIVPTDHRDDLFIEFLRDQSPLLNRVGMNLSGLRGNVDIPKQGTSVSGDWVAEDGGVDTEALTFGNITMKPHTFTAASAMTRRLMQQSSPTIEAVVRADLLETSIAELEETILIGDSASKAEQPDGIWNLSGASTVTITKKGEPTYRELAQFVSTAKKSKTLITKNMSDSDVDNHSFVWVVSAEMEEYFTTTLTSANSHKFMMEDDKILNIPVIVSPHIGANDFGLIDPSQIILGTWSAVDIQVDDSTKAKSGGRIIRSFYDLDIGFRHEKSFVLVDNPTS